MDALKPGYKAYTELEGRNFTGGWDEYLTKVGKYYRTYDPSNPSETPKWARDVIGGDDGLIKNFKLYEDHLDLSLIHI